MTSNKSTSSAQPGQAPLTIGKGAELGEIIVFIDGHTEAPSILEFAGLLAEEHGAHLIGVFMQPAPKVTTAQTFARGKGIREVMQVQEQEIGGIEGTTGPYSRIPCVVMRFSRGRSGDHCPT